VCTKGQLRGIVEQEATRCGSFYVTERWLGGMLTNFETIRKQIRRLKELERGQEENAFEFYTKKERLLLERERLKLDKYFSGVKDMGRLPGAMFVVDARRETIAVKEAARLGIPVIAITDTNADPDPIDFPIPGNDDAIRSVSLITRAIADAVRRPGARSPRRIAGGSRIRRPPPTPRRPGRRPRLPATRPGSALAASGVPAPR
jgi:small subunit ribosomal protein S2